MSQITKLYRALDFFFLAVFQDHWRRDRYKQVSIILQRIEVDVDQVSLPLKLILPLERTKRTRGDRRNRDRGQIVDPSEGGESQRTNLLVKMQYQDDDGQNHRRTDKGDDNARDPIARVKIQLPGPTIRLDHAGRLMRVDDEERVRHDSFKVGVMLGLVSSRPHEQVLHVIVGPAETEVGVRCERGEIGGLRELSD